MTDRVLPDVPVREWVLSVPFEETLAWYRRRAVEIGISGGECGAISVQHRFGGALNLNCHVHAAVIDGVFTRDDQGERAVFHGVPAPDPFALAGVTEGVYRRLVAWLRREGLLGGCDRERAEAADLSAMDACVSTSLSQDGLVRLDARGLRTIGPAERSSFAIAHEPR